MIDLFSQAVAGLFKPLRNAVNALISKPTINASFLKDLEKTLIEADMGRTITNLLVEHVKKQDAHDLNRNEIRTILREKLMNVLSTVSYNPHGDIYLMIGINGAGKTTTAAKLAYHFMQQGKRVLMVAADTFRAGALEQLTIWANHYNIPLITGTKGQDPAAVIFNALQTYKTSAYDCLIIDTAGRLHTNTNLMAELTKMKRVIHRHAPEKKIVSLLTLDALLGQNSYEQARLFHEHMSIDGVILTKLDSSCKGGIVYTLVHQLHLPIAYLAFGETINDLRPFDTVYFINNTVPPSHY